MRQPFASGAAVVHELLLAHIYIGTLGMEGAFEAMGSGDLNWAREDHDLWLAQQLANVDRQGQPSAAPAE